MIQPLKQSVIQVCLGLRCFEQPDSSSEAPSVSCKLLNQPHVISEYKQSAVIIGRKLFEEITGGFSSSIDAVSSHARADIETKKDRERLVGRGGSLYPEPLQLLPFHADRKVRVAQPS